jgi:deazaflavin-dependent oxidoreductase (nitroreductase family)
MNQSRTHFIQASLLARLFSRCYGWLAGRGLGLSYSWVLEVAGRRTGKPEFTPVNLLSHDGKLFLVATRGQTQWARNAAAAGKLALKKGRVRMEFRLRVLRDEEKPKILKAYLLRFNWMVARFFPVRAGSPSTAFKPIAHRYPVFELIRS